MKRFMAVLAMVAVTSAPLHADILPTRRMPKSDEGKKVEARLVQLGVPAEAAQAQVKQLTQDEAAYFARNTDRVQMAGQEMWAGQSDNLWWEWAFGAGFLGGTAWATWIIVKD